MSRRAAAALLLAVVLPACRAGYAERVAAADRAFVRGELQAAEQALEVGPDDRSAHADLLRLERALVLAAAGRRGESAGLLMAADARLEELDYARAPLDDLARQLFSLETRAWRPGRLERVLLNVENLLNFLMLGERESAAVEARRARILLTQGDLPPDERPHAPLAWALAGLALETAGSHAEAADAWRELGALSAPGELGGPGDPDAPGEPDAPDAQAEPGFAVAPGLGEGNVVVVVQADRAPVTVATDYWLPLGGTLRRLEIPVAVARPRRFAGARVRLDGGPWHALPSRLDVEAELLRHNARARPRLLAAAALAMLPRAVATDALRERVGDGEGGARDAAAQIGGVALDAWLGEALPADTRSWTLLPAEVFCDRFRLPAGRHLLQLELSGAEPRRLDWDFDLEPGGLALLDLVTAAGPPGVEPDAEAAPESPLRAPDAGRNLTDTPEGRQALALLGALGLVDPPRRAAPPRRTGLPRRSQAHHGLQHGVQHGAAPPLVPGGSLPFPGVCHQFPGPSLPKE